ncbi:MAG: hypothetical protein GC202_04770 [Alphaproteobacteria bacterium]|nr:hypothetical protein [Alphaproteobacteria bacterium]
MPHLDPKQARNLLGRAPEAEAELDVRGLPLQSALERIGELVDKPVLPGPRSYAILIDPPVPGGGETLFKPIGRYLLDALRSGRIGRFVPLSDPAGGGFFVDVVGN